MHFDRGDGKFKAVSNLFIGQPLGDQRQDFLLSIGELSVAAL